MSGGDLLDLDKVAAQIRERLQRGVRDMIAIGTDLLRVKAQLDHGTFGNWLEREFRFTSRTAQRFMRAAEWAEGKSDIVSYLPAHAIRLLSAPTTPEPIQEAVVEAIRGGADVDFQEVGERIRREREIILDGRKKEQRKEARLQGKSLDCQKRLERQMAREAAEREQRAQERQNLVDEARSILRQLPPADLARLHTIGSGLRLVYLYEVIEGLDPGAVSVEVAPVIQPVEDAPAAPSPRIPSTPDEIQELRAWAQTIRPDRLVKHVAAVPGCTGLASQVEGFLDGKTGSYHLREAIATVRADLADYPAEARP